MVYLDQILVASLDLGVAMHQVLILLTKNRYHILWLLRDYANNPIECNKSPIAGFIHEASNLIKNDGKKGIAFIGKIHDLKLSLKLFIAARKFFIGSQVDCSRAL